MARNKGQDNLIPFDKRTEAEQRAIRKKGGIASGKVRAEKADFKKKCLIWMQTEVARDKNGNPLTGADLMVSVAGREISKGNPKFWEMMRDTAGFKPVDKVMVAEVEQDTIDEVERMVLGDEDANDNTNETAGG